MNKISPQSNKYIPMLMFAKIYIYTHTYIYITVFIKFTKNE